jgi:hypothetical protein
MARKDRLRALGRREAGDIFCRIVFQVALDLIPDIKRCAVSGKVIQGNAYLHRGFSGRRVVPRVLFIIREEEDRK